MATRTFDGLDLINYVLFDAGPTGGSTTNLSNGRVQITGADSFAGTINNNQSGSASVGSLTNLGWTGDIDYTQIPVIPSDALISLVRLTCQAEFSLSADMTSTPAGGALVPTGATVGLGARVIMAFGSLQTPLMGGVDSNGGPGPITAVASFSQTYGPPGTAVELAFDPPITFAELVSTYTSIQFLTQTHSGTAEATGVASVTLSPGGSASINGSASVSVLLDNFQFVVTYELPPDGPFTLTPPSGEVEEGEQIVVEGPVEDLEFAALIGDKVIPIIPKIISPTEVLLEVPAPPTDECVASIAACPECTECFTVCEDDLTSEACQACLESCFQCLENELENTEAAEACQQSSQEPPEIPMVIICGDPGTQFTGSVPLGDFTIIVANGSGLYRLISGKKNDTLYRTERDGSTYDVKIPFPGGKTGFFRS